MFTLLYFAGMVVEIILRSPYDRKRRAIPKRDQRITGAERWLIPLLSVTLLLLPALYGLTAWLSFADYPWTATTKSWMGMLGVVFLCAAIWLFWRSHADLGTNWSPTLEINTQQTLITQGIYRSIRHPMYASQLLWGIAQALLLPNWLAGWGGLVVFLLLYFVRVPHEERMMLDHFGDAYRVYCERTGRIVPRWRVES